MINYLAYLIFGISLPPVLYFVYFLLFSLHKQSKVFLDLCYSCIDSFVIFVSVNLLKILCYRYILYLGFDFSYSVLFNIVVDESFCYFILLSVSLTFSAKFNSETIRNIFNGFYIGLNLRKNVSGSLHLINERNFFLLLSNKYDFYYITCFS